MQYIINMILAVPISEIKSDEWSTWFTYNGCFVTLYDNVMEFAVVQGPSKCGERWEHNGTDWYLQESWNIYDDRNPDEIEDDTVSFDELLRGVSMFPPNPDNEFLEEGIVTFNPKINASLPEDDPWADPSWGKELRDAGIFDPDEVDDDYDYSQIPF